MKLRRAFWILGFVIVFAFGALSLLGFEMGDEEKKHLPPEARSTSGYRSFHFWGVGK